MTPEKMKKKTKMTTSDCPTNCLSVDRDPSWDPVPGTLIAKERREKLRKKKNKKKKTKTKKKNTKKTRVILT